MEQIDRVRHAAMQIANPLPVAVTDTNTGLMLGKGWTWMRC